MSKFDERLDEILSNLMKDAISNRQADDPPQGRKMLLSDAKQAIRTLILEEFDALENLLLDASIALDNEDTAVKWDVIVEALNQRKKLLGE